MKFLAKLTGILTVVALGHGAFGYGFILMLTCFAAVLGAGGQLENKKVP